MAEMNLQRDARVFTADGEVGRVRHVVVDPETREVTDLVVEAHDRQYLIPIQAVDTLEGDCVTLAGTADAHWDVRFEREAYHPVDDERVRRESQREALHGGAPLMDARADAVQVGEPAMRTTVVEPTADYVIQRRVAPVTSSDAMDDLDSPTPSAPVAPVAHGDAAVVEPVVQSPQDLMTDQPRLGDGPLPDAMPPAPHDPRPGYRPDSPTPVKDPLANPSELQRPR